MKIYNLRKHVEYTFTNWVADQMSDWKSNKIQQPHHRAKIINADTRMWGPLESVRMLGESLRETQLILDPFPHTADDHWLPVLACWEAFWLLRKATTWFTATPLLSVRSSARLHTSASSDTYVAFGVCQRGCLSFTSGMDECVLRLFKLLSFALVSIPLSF